MIKNVLTLGHRHEFDSQRVPFKLLVLPDRSRGGQVLIRQNFGFYQVRN